VSEGHRRRSSVAGSALALLLAFVALLGLACSGKKKATVEAGSLGAFFSPEEAYGRGVALIQQGDLNKAARMLSDARSLYLDFVTLYGDHALAPYAQFQAGMCILLQITHPSKDQSRTFEAIDDLELVGRRWPNSVYARAARGMVVAAETNLATHEVGVGRFYLKRKKYLAAAERFRNVLNDYPEFADLETVYFYLGRALIGSNNPAEGRVYLDKLIHDFPGGRYSESAQRLLVDSGGPLELELASP